MPIDGRDFCSVNFLRGEILGQLRDKAKQLCLLINAWRWQGVYFMHSLLQLGDADFA